MKLKENIAVKKPVISEFVVNCELLVCTSMDIKSNDYVAIEPMITNSHVNSFTGIVVRKEQEVCESIEIVDLKVLHDFVCVDKNFTVVMGLMRMRLLIMLNQVFSS